MGLVGRVAGSRPVGLMQVFRLLRLNSPAKSAGNGEKTLALVRNGEA
jgi:hypothetical protein